jgi:hypothetical protein
MAAARRRRPSPVRSLGLSRLASTIPIGRFRRQAASGSNRGSSERQRRAKRMILLSVRWHVQRFCTSVAWPALELGAAWRSGSPARPRPSAIGRKVEGEGQNRAPRAARITRKRLTLKSRLGTRGVSRIFFARRCGVLTQKPGAGSWKVLGLSGDCGGLSRVLSQMRANTEARCTLRAHNDVVCAACVRDAKCVCAERSFNGRSRLLDRRGRRPLLHRAPGVAR